MNDKETLYQVSTLQALAMGYTRSVIKVKDLLTHGDIGLGTYEDVNGEMILVDGHPYRADENGNIEEVGEETGVPFCAITRFSGNRNFGLEKVQDIDGLKTILNLKIEEDFGLNSMHIARIEGTFSKVMARSEAPYRSQHITLKEVLKKTQKDFVFNDIKGTMVCVYFPDYMDGINAPGWHLHFVSEDRSKGGHVFDLSLTEGKAYLDKISRIEIQLPEEAAFDTYSLKEASDKEIKEVEQGKS
ncbi:MAG: acetolactate decarboxylase [Firmicutes bacterium]|nr:acetolactate decarboxylase [Bacillota bacterium]